MTPRFFAKPLFFTALASALLLTSACGDDSESADDSTSGADTDPTTTTPMGTTAADGTTTDDTMGDATVGGSSSSSGSESSGSDSGSGGAAIGYEDILGSYVDDFDGVHTIEATMWTQAYPNSKPLTFPVEQVDDDTRTVVMAEGEAGTFARFDWDFDDDGSLRFCQAAFGQSTAEDAATADPSDREDFDGVGCGGMFPWSQLTQK